KDPASDRAQLRLCLFEGGPLDPRHDSQPGATAIRSSGWRHPDAHPTCGQPDLRAIREIESWRHHAHDRIGSKPVSVDRDRPPNGVRGAAEAALPEVITQDRRLITLAFVFLGGERAPEYRRHAKRAEQAGGNIGSRDALGVVAACQSDRLRPAPYRIEAHVFENLVPRLPIG